MTEQPDKPPLHLPPRTCVNLGWIGALLVVSWLALLAAILFLIAAIGDGDPVAGAWFVILLFMGMLFRALAGIWAALERMAFLAPPTVPTRSIWRRILGVD